MEEEYEKRFEQISNKLFHTPRKSKPNAIASGSRSLGVQKLIGKKPRNTYSSSRDMVLRGGVVEELGSTMSAQAPSCRPWDRNDLCRRLSTFKSMTWFAKPQVVSPLDCARRGWVNVEMDTIGCESCGARLFFSTPSAWARQQVEKAAMVFSLKLESGHKILCPWSNNACSEELAQFPIVSRAGLIEYYKKRLFALSQLTALPTVSPVAIDNIKIPELEQFLKDSKPGYSAPIEFSRTELPEDVPESVASCSYYQALKLISLCGWEPHLLPYTVDFKHGQKKSIKDANVRVTDMRKQKINIYSLCTEEGSKASTELQFDPSSVVLDCKFCGASVGLWAFFTVSRPVEYFRFAGLLEVNGKNVGDHHQVSAEEGSSGGMTSIGIREGVRDIVTTPSSSLGLTIAGGPPPEMLNYGAAISLPVIGQSLRARFLVDPKDHLAVQTLPHVEKAHQISPANANATTEKTLTVAEGAILNLELNETAETVNSPITDHHTSGVGEFSCSTPNYTTNKNGEESEPSREKMMGVDNYNQGSCPAICQEEDKKLPTLFDSREFDPIKQHRHFCPWIVTSGKFAPGWKETLLALEGNKEFSNFSVNSEPSSSLIEVDDPIASVKNLFRSPEKRTKTVGGS